jgi:hypothetical protein
VLLLRNSPKSSEKAPESLGVAEVESSLIR